MQRFLRAGGAIRQTQALALVRLPAHDPAMGDRQNRTAAPGGNALVLGSGNHDENGLFGHRRQPVAGYRSHEPPFVFFRRMASSTAWSARARSFSSNSALSFSYDSVLTTSTFRPGLAPRRSNAPSRTCWRMRARAVENIPSRRRI